MTWSVISGWTSSSSVRLQKRKEARETVINSMMSKKQISVSVLKKEASYRFTHTAL